MGLFSRSSFTERTEKAARKTLANIRAQRRSRFRILACIDGTDAAYDTVKFAARLSPHDNCDIVLVYVRPIDKSLSSEGLNVKLARQSLLDAGGELPGLRALKRGLEVLKEEGLDIDNWQRKNDHTDAWGDPVGDNKVVFKAENGRSVVLKLKTAPDVASGILEQYEHGPYNLIIINEPSRWRGEFKSIFDSGVVQRVTGLAPCSVLVAREVSLEKTGFLIYNDGSKRAMRAVRRSAILAHSIKQPITLFAVAADEASRKQAQEHNRKARDLLNGLGIEVKRVTTAIGDPVTQIIKAGANQSIIVVPDDVHSRIYRAIYGSTAWGVIKGAVTSVMDVR
jgi:nucleotide-binding universal stress UspA family protein